MKHETLTHRPWARLARPLLVALAASMALSGCTIIRYVENNKPDPEPPDPPPPKVVDMLVFVELDRSATSLASAYNTVILELIGAMAAKNVTARKVALAPMYRRTGESVPLIYGLGDQDAEFSDYGEAIAFFAQDDGQTYLRTSVDADGENLATVGMELDARAIYHPTTADTSGASYFGEAKDGFVVVSMTAKKRACGFEDAACKLDNQNPADYLTREAEGGLSWMKLPGVAKLSKKRVFHLAVATDEGVSDDAFVKRCEGMPGFPAAKLDFMEPSPVAYYKPLVSAINERGGHAAFLDMCTAMSPVQREAQVLSIAGKVAAMF